MFKKSVLMFFMSIGVLLFASSSYAIPISGSSSGIFINPLGPIGMVTTGVGTSSFTWGISNTGPSSLNFTGNSFSVETDDVFSFGSLTYFNGSILLRSRADSVDLNVTLSLTTPSGIEEDFIYDLGLVNTLNTSDPYASADYVNLPSSIPDSFFTVDGVNYTLEFVGFGNITGSGFNTIDRFHVLEGSIASAELLGRVTTTATVPEPSVILLFGSGLAGLVMYRRKKSKTV